MVECGAADASKAAATCRPGMDSAPEPPDGTFWRYAISPQMGSAGDEEGKQKELGSVLWT